MAHSRTNLSSMSELSSQTPVDEIVFPNDQESPDEIFEKICDDLRKICEDIKKEFRTAKRSTVPVANPEKTVVMKEMSTLLENKTSIINKLTALVKESKYDDFPHFKGEATMSIPFMMEEETSSCQQAVQLLENMYQDNLKELELLKECDKISLEISEVDVVPETNESFLRKITTEVDKEFKLCKKDMKNVIDTLYPDSNCLEILGELVKKSVDNDTEWFEINDISDLPMIYLLMTCGVVKLNPENGKQLRLII